MGTKLQCGKMKISRDIPYSIVPRDGALKTLLKGRSQIFLPEKKQNQNKIKRKLITLGGEMGNWYSVICLFAVYSLIKRLLPVEMGEDPRGMLGGVRGIAGSSRCKREAGGRDPKCCGCSFNLEADQSRLPSVGSIVSISRRGSGGLRPPISQCSAMPLPGSAPLPTCPARKQPLCA